MPKVRHITPRLGYTKAADEAFLRRLNAVYAGMNDNPDYPSPPIAINDFKADIDSYSNLITQSLDGSRMVISAKNKKRETLTTSYRILGHYVEITCANDPTTFLSSGFEAASRTRTGEQTLQQPTIRKIGHGNSSELLAYLKGIRRARSYDLHYAPVPAGGGMPETWTTVTVASAKSAVVIGGLTPGTNYMFQVRAFGKTGHTGWSDPISRICG